MPLSPTEILTISDVNSLHFVCKQNLILQSKWLPLTDQLEIQIDFH